MATGPSAPHTRSLPHLPSGGPHAALPGPIHQALDAVAPQHLPRSWPPPLSPQTDAEFPLHLLSRCFLTASSTIHYPSRFLLLWGEPVTPGCTPTPTGPYNPGEGGDGDRGK